MRTFNPEYTAANQARPRRPRHVIALSFDTENTDIVYFTSHADTATPDGAAVIGNVVRNVSSSSQTIDIERAQFSIGRLTFDLVDANRQVTALLADRLAGGDSLRLKRAVYYKGFAGLAWEHYEKSQTAIIESVRQSENAYLFNADDIKRTEKKEIFTQRIATLTKSITATQKHIPITVADLDYFPTVEHDDSYTDRPEQTVGYVKIEFQGGFETVCHRGGFLHATDGPSLDVVKRGALNTVAQHHEVDPSKPKDRRPKVSELIYLEGPALKIMYAIQTGILYGQGGATLPEHWHLGIDPAYINLAVYEAAGPDIWDTSNNTGRMVRGIDLQKTDGKSFIENEILSWLVAFPPIDADGALGFRRADPVLSDGGYVAHITDREIVSISELEEDMPAVINRIFVDWNYNYIKRDFTKQTLLVDGESLSTYGKTQLKEFVLRLVHTGQHTDQDLGNYLNTWRDRYSAAPFLCSVTLLPSYNQYEPGDTLRIDTRKLRDPTTGTDLDRVFEVQSARENPLTGEISYKLFASTQRAGAINPPTTTSVLDDSAYVQGTELSTVLSIVDGVITENGHLDAGTYYYLGDLELAAGVTVTWDGHVNLWLRGFHDVNGKWDGKGRGLAGTPYSSDGNFLGQSGFLGETRAQLGFFALIFTSGENVGTRHAMRDLYGYLPPGSQTFGDMLFGTRGRVTALPFFTVKNLGTGLQGLPDDMLGTSGGYGAYAIRIVGAGGSGVRTEFDGGDGGDGGASMTIVSRGGAFGGAGEIDSSGNDGGLGETFTAEDATYAAGTGAGGWPGGVLWLLDGNHTPPDLAAHHTANVGDCAPQGFQQPLPGPLSYATPITEGQTRSSAVLGFRARDARVAASAIQFIPATATVVEETDPPPSDVPYLVARQVGDQMNFSWGRIPDANRAGYTIKFGSVGTSYDAMQFLTEETRGTRISNAHVPPGTWDFGIKAFNRDGEPSANATITTATMREGDFNIIDEVQQNPAWTGATLTNFGIHYTGKLYPKSQGVAADDGWDTFDVYCPQPYDEYRVETAEQVTDFDTELRAWVDLVVKPGPGEDGEPDFDSEIDHHLTAGSYDGWEPMVLGDINARNVKFRFTMNVESDQPLCYVESLRTVVDTKERTEPFLNQTIAPGGTTLVFDKQFHMTPFVRITPKGATPLIAMPDNLSTTQCDIHLFNLASSDVGGVADIEFFGA